MTILHSISLCASYLSVIGGIGLTLLKLLDVLTGQGVQVLGMTVPFTGLLLSSTSIVTVVLAGLFVLFSIGLVIGIHCNSNLLMIAYLLYTTIFLVYYAVIYFLRPFWVKYTYSQNLRFTIPIGCMIFFLIVITIYFMSNRHAKEKAN